MIKNFILLHLSLALATSMIHAAQRPNIVLIVADDFGYGDLACYGSKINRTPHIDRLAAAGLRFTDFHSNGSMCTPTRAAMLTGQYQQRFGKEFDGPLSGEVTRDHGLPLDAITIAEVLQQHGYATGAFGKWHLGYIPPWLPTSQGFDEFRGLGAGDGDHHTHIDRWGREDWWHNNRLDMQSGYTAELLTQYSVDFITRHQHEPFFLYVPHLAIHFPWQGPDDPPHREKGKQYGNDKWGIIPNPGNVSPHVQAMVASIDKSVGAILETLKQLQLADNTLVIFTSDNGGYLNYGAKYQNISSNRPLRGQKGTLYEGGHRVPMIFYWPDKITPAVTDATALSVDLFPTFAKLAEINTADRTLDGVDLTRLLFEAEPLADRMLFWRAGLERAVRHGPWKLVADGDRVELFNLAEDLGEQHDLSKQLPQRLASLNDAWHNWEIDTEQNSPDSVQTEQKLPDFYFDPADETAGVTHFDNPLSYDADVAVHEQQKWFAWLEFTPGKGDQIWVGQRDGRQWETRELVTEQPGQFACPTLTVDSQGRWWLSYEKLSRDQWDVMVVSLVDGKATGKPIRVSTNASADIHHRVAADRQGNLWFAWQSDRGGQFDVVVRQMKSDSLGALQVIGEHPTGDWHPSVAVDEHNSVYVVWDAYDGESFNVYLRTFRNGNWSETRDVANTAAFEGRAQVTVNGDARRWIAWEEGGKNWGKPYRGIKTELITDHKGPLHRFRQLRIALLDKDDSIKLLADFLPMPSLAQARQREDRHEGIEKSGTFYERIKLATDAQGRLWVVYRHNYTPWLGVEHRSHIEEGWGLYARHYGADGWSKLYRMNIGQGDGMQRLELASRGDGITAVWTTGRTHRDRNQRPRGVMTANIVAKNSIGAGHLELSPTTLTVESTPSTINDNGTPTRKRGTNSENSQSLTLASGCDGSLAQTFPKNQADSTATNSPTSKQYQLFYGDLHRHTDLSLCRVPIDGTIDDAYRYAIEVAQLDFLGITDHSRDIAQGDPLSQLWWRCRKEVLRHQLGHDFIPFFAYERSHSHTADHNVISLRGDMLRPHTYPLPDFWNELDRNTITIAHQPIRRDTWNYQNDNLRPLAEIFQGCRDNSIEEDVHRGLARGYHLGFIASSDHMSTSASYACVWAPEATRESIFQAMQARRTFGATDKIRLIVKAGDHWMGEIIAAEQMPKITLDAQGTAPIESVHLIIDGKIYETTSPNEQQVKLRRQLDLAGEHYAYFHLVQTDGNQAWSSPIWLDIGHE